MCKIHFISDYSKSNPITSLPSVLKKPQINNKPTKKQLFSCPLFLLGEGPGLLGAQRSAGTCHFQSQPKGARPGWHICERICSAGESGTRSTEAEHIHQAGSFGLTLQQQMKLCLGLNLHFCFQNFKAETNTFCHT